MNRRHPSEHLTIRSILIICIILSACISAKAFLRICGAATGDPRDKSSSQIINQIINNHNHLEDCHHGDKNVCDGNEI